MGKSETNPVVKKALKKIIGMAYSRTEFKNKIEEKIGGALFEFLKAEIAKINKETKWVKHWESEVNRLLDSDMVVVLLHSITFKNKSKAAMEVVEALRGITPKYISSAKKQLETSYFKKPFKKDINSITINKFFDRIVKIIEINA